MVSDPQTADADIDKRICIKGFPKETTEGDLTSFFETYGVVKHVNIKKDHKSGLAKYAFVTFESKEVREELCREKALTFQEKTLCIKPAKRNVRNVSEKCNSTFKHAAHEFRRYFPTRQAPHEYTASPTAPMPAYCVYPFYNQNVMYVPAGAGGAVQPSPIVPIPSAIPYQNSYMTANPAAMFTPLMPANSPSTSYVQGIGSKQYLLPMPRTNFLGTYHDFQHPPIIPMPYSPSFNDPSMPICQHTDDYANVYQNNQCFVLSPSKPRVEKVYGSKENLEVVQIDDDSSPPSRRVTTESSRHEQMSARAMCKKY